MIFLWYNFCGIILWFKQIAINIKWFPQQQKNCSFCQFLTVFPLFMQIGKSLPSLFTQLHFSKEWQDWFALIACLQMSDGSESLPLLLTKEWKKERKKSELLCHSQKQVIHSKNHRADSRPCSGQSHFDFPQHWYHNVVMHIIVEVRLIHSSTLGAIRAACELPGTH